MGDHQIVHSPRNRLHTTLIPRPATPSIPQRHDPLHLMCAGPLNLTTVPEPFCFSSLSNASISFNGLVPGTRHASLVLQFLDGGFSVLAGIAPVAGHAMEHDRTFLVE